ncbi:MAG: class I SAM-dependent methyltransferase [Bacteroidota bacterium]|nr:class I SAM-dependent methyltransferase [Bacteroidota bacterium]
MTNRLQTIKTYFSSRPLNVIIWKAYCKIFNSKIPDLKSWKFFIKNKSGLEIGGPSNIFSANNYLPVYPFVQSLDGVNFSNKTIWEGEIKQGNNYLYDGKKGFQFIAEGTDLQQIKDNIYDFVLSCNNLEHIANPVKALLEWKRLIKPGGTIILLLPRKESNFDHLRKVTSFEHIKKDFENNTAEDDLTHFKEILELHDLKRDPHAGSFENFKKRSQHNFENRSLHHHVFDIALLTEMIKFIGMKVSKTYSSPTDHFIAATKED